MRKIYHHIYIPPHKLAHHYVLCYMVLTRKCHMAIYCPKLLMGNVSKNVVLAINVFSDVEQLTMDGYTERSSNWYNSPLSLVEGWMQKGFYMLLNWLGLKTLSLNSSTDDSVAIRLNNLTFSCFSCCFSYMLYIVYNIYAQSQITLLAVFHVYGIYFMCFLWLQPE